MIDDNLSVLPDGLRMLLQRLDERGVVVVDVREPDEFADWSIANSVNIPLTDFNFVGKVEKLVGGRPIVTICTRGNRSIYAAEVLQEGGMQARSLEGGLVAWSKIHICAEVRVPQFGDTKILQIRRLLRGCTSYIVAGKTDCAVFDPSSDAAQYTSIASKYGFRITHVVDTHQHADHISGARTLANETGAKLHLSAHEEYEFDGFEPVEEGSTISLNRGGLAIEAIDTPGHTVGSACFLIEKRALISGDTLFLEGVGRPDLNGKAEQRARDLYRSCRSVFSRLDPEVLVLPGHFDLPTH